MSRAPLSLFILNRRSLPSGSPKPYSPTLGLLRRAHSHPFSTSSLTPSPEPGPKPSNLSARLSFVFDQIDAIEKQREQSQKDETLRRIRAWREAKNVRSVQSSVAGESQVESGLSSSSRDGNEIMREEPSGFNDGGELKGDDSVKKLELVHPWVEWIELMERLVQHNYFDHRRKDEEKMVRELGFEEGDVPEERFNFNADFKAVQSACLNFGKDRFDILRSLSRQDIQILVGHGCPSSDRKVTLSAKLLRKHVHLDEGDVCSSCSLRSSCEKAYLLTNKEDEARTVDVMRVLSTFGLDHAHGLVTNKSLLKQKSVKTVIRKLLHEIVKLSAVPIDPNLPPPIIKRPPPKVKQPPPPPKKRVGRDDIEMKKGDWLCPKCDFMNFAKNTVCLQCDAKRPKRQLLPGEWECPECNFLNYRRNMVCFHCECKRPPDQFMEDKLEERHQNSRTRLEKKASRPEVSNAWNFDFDDDESDGADVAAFEYADSAAKGEDFPLNSWDQSKSQGHEDGFQRGTKFPRVSGREYPDSEKSSRIGFDDFDDEEDDVNSYELDTGNSHSARSGPFRDFSEMDGDSDYDNGDSNNEPLSRHNARSRSLERPPSKSPHRAHALPRSDGDEMGFDSDNESLVHPNWRSSHVADSRHTGKARTAPGKFRGLSYGSDEEIDLSSDSDDYSREDFGKKKSRGNKISGKGRRQRKSLLYTSESDDDVSSRETQFRRNRVDSKRRESKFGGRNSRSNWNSSLDDDDFHRPLRGARGNYDGRGPRSDVSTGKRVDRRGNGSRKYKGENFENRKWERRNRYEDDRGNDSDDFRNRRRIIER